MRAPAETGAGTGGAKDDALLPQPKMMRWPQASPAFRKATPSHPMATRESDAPMDIRALEARRSQPRRRRVSFAATPVEEAIERVAEAEIGPSTALIVPLTVERGEIAVLIPSEEEYCFGIQRGAKVAETIVDKCVAAVQRGSTNLLQTIG